MSSVVLRVKKKKKLEPGSVYFFAPLFHGSGATVSFQHVPSERAVGVSAILLAVRCHPSSAAP